MDTGSGLMEIGNEPADGGHVFVGVYAPNKIEVVVCLIISFDMLLCKVKSAYKQSGPSGRSVSQFLQHEVTRSISTPPGYTWVESRHWESEVLFPRTQHNVLSAGLEPN